MDNQVARDRAKKLQLKNPDYYATIGALGGAKSGSRPMRDRPGYASELAKRRWAKFRENKANEQKLQKAAETLKNP